MTEVHNGAQEIYLARVMGPCYMYIFVLYEWQTVSCLALPVSQQVK